jgi:chromosome segregation ATPase
MNNQHRREQSQASDRQGDGDNDAGFVVPEPDGVQSGLPFGSDAPNEAGGSKPTGKAMARGQDYRGASSTMQGLSLKRKLTLSLGLLTLVILILGAVSMFTLHQIGVQGIGELRNHAELARLADAIRNDIAVIHDAEQDFLLLEDANAIDQVAQLSARVRKHIAEINAAGARILHSEGMSIEERFDGIAAAIDSYEKRFVGLSKLVQEDRRTLAAGGEQQASAAAQLRAGLEASVANAETLIERYWERLSIADGRSTDAWVREREQAQLLNGFARDLIGARARLDAFIAGRDSSYPEVARETLTETLAQLDLIRNQNTDARLKRELGELRKSLLTYSAQLREAGTRVSALSGRAAELNARIEREKDALRDIGAEVIKDAEGLSADAWRDIGHETDQLRQASTVAQWVLGVTVLIGALIGLLVLFRVPRPIVAAID